MRAAVDAAAAVCGAPPTPASGGHVGDCHHRRHGRLPRLLFLISRSYVRSQAAPVVQVTLTHAALDLPMYLSSCENSSIVLQVQGVFANALSVVEYRSKSSSAELVIIVKWHPFVFPLAGATPPAS